MNLTGDNGNVIISGCGMTTLTMRDEKRIEIIERVFRDELTVVEAATILGISEWQCYRIKVRVKKQGVKGVVHGNRGRPCKRKIKESTVRQIVKLARGKYQGFKDHHLTEKLKEEEQIELRLSFPSSFSVFQRCLSPTAAEYILKIEAAGFPGSPVKPQTEQRNAKVGLRESGSEGA